MRRLLAIVAVLVPLALLAAGTTAGTTHAARAGAAASGPTPRTPIRHFLMLMQEGHSFDNYFGRYPGADGLPGDACLPADPDRRGGRCVRPFHLGDRSASLPHSARTFRNQLNGGRMDGFVRALSRIGAEQPQAPMGFYDARDIPFYWNLADRYVLFDRFFAASSGGSVSNHMFWLTGTPGDRRYPDRIPPGGFRSAGAPATIFDRLQERGLSWKVYIQDYDPGVTFRTAARPGVRSTQATWMPLLSYPRYVDDPDLRRHFVDLSELFADAARGTLPAVAYVVPASSSEHPPGRVESGARLIRRIVGSLLLSRLWKSSAFMWTYDNWGGWYDHVRPPRVDRDGYGFRVPALLVSAWARRGHVDHTTLDVTSALRFIQYNWNLRPLASRDAKATPFLGAFDFAAGPRRAVIPPIDRAGARPVRARRAVIYAGYGGAALLGLAVIAAAAAGTRRRRPRPAARTRGAHR
jgi:phospholipase C